jgi:hypothetical protein
MRTSPKGSIWKTSSKISKKGTRSDNDQIFKSLKELEEENTSFSNESQLWKKDKRSKKISFRKSDSNILDFSLSRFERKKENKLSKEMNKYRLLERVKGKNAFSPLNGVENSLKELHRMNIKTQKSIKRLYDMLNTLHGSPTCFEGKDAVCKKSLDKRDTWNEIKKKVNKNARQNETESEREGGMDVKEPAKLTISGLATSEANQQKQEPVMYFHSHPNNKYPHLKILKSNIDPQNHSLSFSQQLS